MKEGNWRQGNKQKDHQSIRDSKWGNWGKVKLSREMLRGEEKGNRRPGRSICQGRSAVFQAQCLCAIWITAGFSCPRLFYIKLRQLLDFPHYCHGIGLIQCPSMFSLSSASIRRDLLSQVTGHLSPSAHCYGGDISRYGQCMAHCIQNSTSLGNKFVIQHGVPQKAEDRIHTC